MSKLLLALIIYISSIVIIGCQNKKQSEPIFNLDGIKTSITKIQISSVAFDGAQVVVLGFVKEIKLDSEQNILLLSDEYGNSINVEYKEITELNKNETVIVNGKYRKNKNIIIADNIIKVSVSRDGIRPADSR